MKRFFASIAATVVLCAISLLSAQTQTATSGNISATVTSPDSVECSMPFVSTLSLSAIDVQDPGVADMVFVLDESGSINGTSFNQMKQFVRDVITAVVPAAGGGARVGIAMFSTSARTITNLSGDRTQLINFTNAITQVGGFTCIECGVREAREIFDAGPPRPEATKFMIVLTDGNHNPASSTFANTLNQARAAGITILAIGVGSGVSNATIQLIASDIAGVQTAFFTTDFNQLSTIINTLTAAIVSPFATNITVNVTGMPRFPIITADATAGSATLAGSSVVWTFPSLGAASRTLQLQHHHDGTGNGPLQIFNATYTDADGNVVDIPVPSTTVTGCNTAPVANAGFDTTEELSGTTTKMVHLNGGDSTDDGLLGPLTYSWASDVGGYTATGPTPTFQLPFGTYLFTLTVNDGEFSDTDDVMIVIGDPTPPVIARTVAGTLGDNDWYRSNVDVTFTASDPETGIASSSGCGTSTLATDTTGQLFTCSATNGAGASSSADETVKRDATAPTLVVSGPVTAEATSGSGATVSYQAPIADDPTSGVATVGCTPASGSLFGPGSTPVSCHARDHAGNTTNAGFTVTVRDTTAPEIGDVTPSLSSLWPANHKMVAVTIAAAATDSVSSATCHITGVSSSEPDNGLGDGDTANDIVITGPLSLQLRAERAGNGPGRTYTIDITCTDASGNSATESTTVTVAHSSR